MEKSEGDEVTKRTAEETIVLVATDNELVKYLLVMENKFYGFVGKDAFTILYQLAVRNGIKKSTCPRQNGRKSLATSFPSRSQAQALST
jgi:hypothetical protein